MQANACAAQVERISYGICCVVNDTFVYVFGGMLQNHVNHLYKFNTHTQEWSQVVTSTPAPAPRGGHAMITRQQALIVYGGYSHNSYLNDMVQLNLSTLQWKPIQMATPIEPRSAFAYCYCPRRDTLVTHGGSGCATKYGFSEFEFATNKWQHHDTEAKTKTTTTPSTAHAMCLIAPQRIVMSCNAGNSLAYDLLEYDLQSKQQLCTYKCRFPFPLQDMHASMVFVPKFQSVFYIGKTLHQVYLPHSDSDLHGEHGWQAKVYQLATSNKFTNVQIVCK